MALRTDKQVYDRLSDLVRLRSTTGGHALWSADADRFAATIALLPPVPATVLDVGCGTGVLADVLAELGYAAWGIDTDETAMAQMVQRHQVASVDSIPAPDSSTDVVVANEVLEHLSVNVYSDSIREMARVARRSIIVTVPNAESLESATTRCPECSCVFSVHGHVRRFDKRYMPMLIPGFALDHLTTVGPWKLRHRTFEWHIRRRLLGSWPAQPGAVCPQCNFRQPGSRVPSPATVTPLGSAVRWAFGFPWQRWWLVARYHRVLSNKATGPNRERLQGRRKPEGAPVYVDRAAEM